MISPCKCVTLSLGFYHKCAPVPEGQCDLPGPTLTFGFVMATLYGALFHLLVGGDARRLALFLLAGWIGFALGHLMGVTLGFNVFNIGSLRIVAASVGAVLALLMARVLTAAPARPTRR